MGLADGAAWEKENGFSRTRNGLRDDDPVYYKVKLQKLFKQAQENGIKIELGKNEVSFSNNISERASAKVNNN